MTYLVRCLCLVIMVLLAASQLPHSNSNTNFDATPTMVASGGSHLWWIATQSYGSKDQFELHHHALSDDERQFQVASIFQDKPIAVAADGAQVWVVFDSHNDKMEVVSGATQLNPASELWFITQGGALQLCPSIVGNSLESLAAFNGEPWVIVKGETVARVLRGGQWNAVELPTLINNCAHRRLVVAGGVLNVLGQTPDKSIRRFKRESQAWIESRIQVADFLYPIDHAVRFACVTGQPSGVQTLNWVEAGEVVPIVALPMTKNFTSDALGAGNSFAWIGLQIHGTENSIERASMIASLPSGATQFSQPVVLRTQVSKASRWYHLPILGVLSLGAIIAAFLVRSLNSPGNPAENTRSTDGDMDRQALAYTPATPLQKWRRLAATGIDVLPFAIVSIVLFEAYSVQIFIPPLWSADIQLSIPYLAMVIAAIAFSMLQEILFGRSMGKRLMGGRVVCINGEPAAWWQHIVRNLLKGLVLLSPVLAIPSLLSATGEGIPDVISRTKVEGVTVDDESLQE